MARLTREARREQLLELGAQMIAKVGFDQFSIDELALRAGISRSLLFHYFDHRQGFLVAVAEQAAQEVLDVTEPDSTAPPAVQLLSALEGFLDYLAKRGDQYVALVRGAAGGDAAMQAVFSRTRAALAQRMIDGVLGEGVGAPPMAHLAARGQVALAEEVIVGWLTGDEAQRVARDQIVRFLSLSTVDALRRSGIVLDAELVALLDPFAVD
jgi:AcrR family transcriptional regulator